MVFAAFLGTKDGGFLSQEEVRAGSCARLWHWFIAALSSHCGTAEMKTLVAQTIVEEVGVQAVMVPPTSPEQHLPNMRLGSISPAV